MLVENRDFFHTPLHSTPPFRGFPSEYCIPFGTEQELSYRKQIARQLRTEFVEGIYRSDYA